MSTKEEHMVGALRDNQDVFYVIALKGKKEYINKNAGGNTNPGPTLGMYSTPRLSQAKTFAERPAAEKAMKALVKNKFFSQTRKGIEYEVLTASVIIYQCR